MKSTLIVYHGHCTDGFTAAWAAWKKFGDSAEYVPATYKPSDVFDVEGRDVYILDYCPRTLKEVQEYKQKAKSLTILDHHKTSEALCQGLDYAVFDMKRSGAGLAWDYFHSGTPRPLLVDLVEDRDLWLFAKVNSKRLNLSIASRPLGSFEDWDYLATEMTNDPEKFWVEGAALHRAETVTIEGAMHHAISSRFMGYENVPVVNISGIVVSDVLNKLAAEPSGFAVGWYLRAPKEFKYSLRSKGDFDVAILAEKHGGGGHKNASAFTSDKAPWELT